MKVIMNDMKLVSLAIVLAGFTQFLTNGTAPTEMVHSFIAMSVIVFLSLVAKKFIPSSLPTFAYATIIGILICLPETPVRTYFLESVGKIQFLSVCAAAGICRSVCWRTDGRAEKDVLESYRYLPDCGDQLFLRRVCNCANWLPNERDYLNVG